MGVSGIYHFYIQRERESVGRWDELDWNRIDRDRLGSCSREILRPALVKIQHGRLMRSKMLKPKKLSFRMGRQRCHVCFFLLILNKRGRDKSGQNNDVILNSY